MNINFELYRIFYVVANTKNITKASQELFISQPAISKAIMNLEKQLGGQLFIRTKRGVVLTEEGKEFYNYIKQAIEFINNAENKFTDLINLETGCIKIGISTTLTKEFLLPYLKKFHKLYPKIDIQIITNMTSELMVKLKNGLIDLIILNLPYNHQNDVDIIKCKEIQDCFIANENYLQLVNKKVKVEELNNYPLILQIKGSNTRTFIDDFARQNNIILKPNMELASYSLVVEFTKIGLGIGYATKEYITKELDNKELYILDVEPKLPKRNIGIATSKNNLPNFSTKKLIKIITEQ
jgi:LysR family transcriptional regulator, cyn operon transcriptional activator